MSKVKNPYICSGERVSIKLQGGGFVCWTGYLPWLRNVWASKGKNKYEVALRILSDGWGLTFSEAEAILMGDVKSEEISEHGTELRIQFNTRESKTKQETKDA